MKFTKCFFILIIIAIGILSINPDAVQRKMTDSFDLSSGGYLFHILAYAVLCFLGLLNAAFHNTLFPFKMLGLILIYGTVLELIQYFLPYRTFNPLDILANIIGVVVSCLLFAQHLFFNVKHCHLSTSYFDYSIDSEENILYKNNNINNGTSYLISYLDTKPIFIK